MTHDDGNLSVVRIIMSSRSLSIRAVLVLGVTIITLIMAIAVVMFLRQGALLQHTHALVIHTHEVEEALQNLTNTVKDALVYQRNYLVSRNDVFLNLYQSLTVSKDGNPSSITLAIKRLKYLIQDNPYQVENGTTLAEAVQGIIDFNNELTSRRMQDKGFVVSSDMIENSHVLMNTVRLTSAAMRDEETRLLQMRTFVDEATTQHNTILVLSFIGTFYIIELFLLWLVFRHWEAARTNDLLQQKHAAEVVAANKELQTAYDRLAVLNEQIRETGQARLRAVVDYALDGLITINDQGNVESFNPACERIFGYKAEEVVGQNIKILMPEPYQSQHDGYIKNYHETGKAAIIGTPGREVSGKRKNGSVFPMDLSICSFTIDGQKYFSGILRDITKRKESEAELLRYTKQLEHSNQELDDFAYIASHDLKEPLRGLFNHASFILEDYGDKLDDEGQRRLNRLLRLAQRMENLVNDLLYFSRLGRGELAIQMTDPNMVIREITQMMESFLKERGAQIVMPSIMPSITCDRPRLTEVFRNLITNAIKYNDKAERTIEVGFLNTVMAPHGMEENVFYIKDNGIGIAPEFHQDIFRIFKRLNKDDDKESGTGVGLTFVKKIVERHKGHVWLESIVGRGTTFYFNLNQEATHHDELEHQEPTKYLAG
jgi:PAS domain S-box-containing protein